MTNHIEQKLFLGKEVRIVNDQYIVLKDMMNVLGQVYTKSDGKTTWSVAKTKTLEFLEDIGKMESLKSFEVLVKQGKSRVQKEVECLKIETAPIVVTQFRPTTRRGEEALNEWRKFMVFVDELLVGAKAHEMIIKSAEDYKSNCKQLEDYGSKNFGLMATNMKRIMARLIGVDGLVSKDELKYYKDQTTIDLLYAYDWCLSKMVDNYGIVEDLEQAYQMTKKLAKKKFPNSAL